MGKDNFYCKNKCIPPDFSIDEWNAKWKLCEDGNIVGEARDRILSPEKFPCKEQCFDCMVIVGDRQRETKRL